MHSIQFEKALNEGAKQLARKFFKRLNTSLVSVEKNKELDVEQRRQIHNLLSTSNSGNNILDLILCKNVEFLPDLQAKLPLILSDHEFIFFINCSCIY